MENKEVKKEQSVNPNKSKKDKKVNKNINRKYNNENVLYKFYGNNFNVQEVVLAKAKKGDKGAIEFCKEILRINVVE